MKKLIIALIFFGNFSVFSQTIDELPDVTKLYFGERDGELITRNYIEQIADKENESIDFSYCEPISDTEIKCKNLVSNLPYLELLRAKTLMNSEHLVDQMYGTWAVIPVIFLSGYVSKKLKISLTKAAIYVGASVLAWISIHPRFYRISIDDFLATYEADCEEVKTCENEIVIKRNMSSLSLEREMIKISEDFVWWIGKYVIEDSISAPDIEFYVKEKDRIFSIVD